MGLPLVKTASMALSRRQRGVVLVIGMLFLVVLTVLVISLMRTSILEEKMVFSSRDWNIAFQAAEAALRDAERDITNATRFTGETGFESGCNADGLCLPNTCTETDNCKPIWIALAESDTAWRTGTISTGGSSKSIAFGDKTGESALTGLAVQPRYIIEVLLVPEAGSLKVAQGGQPL